MQDLYRGEGATRGLSEKDLPLTDRAKREHPSGYLADEGLRDAVNVALHLAQPLMLTGAPGTGKTQLARSLAWELSLGEALIFETKSTSTARDLFYTFDTLTRFHMANMGKGEIDNRHYITYGAFGRAILLANHRKDVEHLLPPRFEHDGPRRAVVLIDEIDKAPRDFPNDLLNEIEHMYFKIPELDNEQVSAPPEKRPILVLSSNSEKNLPDAFLRRCIYYHIDFPVKSRLEEILLSRIDGLVQGEGKLLDDAIRFFEKIREEEAGMSRKPSPAELIEWVSLLVKSNAAADTPLDEKLAAKTLSTLAKEPNDQKLLRDLLKQHLAGTRPAG